MESKMIRRIIRTLYLNSIGRVERLIKIQHRKKVVKYAFESATERLDIENLNDVLIIAPHPDDEVFGCGMLIKTLCDAKRKVDVLILSKGESALPENVISKQDLIAKRRALCESALEKLGLDVTKHLYFGSLPDGNFINSTKAEKEELQTLIFKIFPKVVFSVHPLEFSKDHVASADIVNEAIANMDVKHYHYLVWLYYKCPIDKISSIDFSKAKYHIGDLESKHNSMNIYSNAKTPTGDYLSCKLPRLFLDFCGHPKELYFEN